MSLKLSRRKIAQYAAMQIIEGATVRDVLQEVAAYLIETRRVRESELVTRAIEDELAHRGHVIAEVTTAKTPDESLATLLQTIIHSDKLYIREIIDSDVVGGIIIQTPGKKLDASIRTKLTALRRAKI